jgi:hypothetical protein
MSAGLPGLGLGGLFFILSALLAPFIEIGRMAIGRRREVNWPQVWRQFAMSLAMIAAVDLTLRAIYAASYLLGLGSTPRVDVITVIPLIPVAITACLLAAVLLTAKVVDLATPVLRGLPRLGAFPSRTRVLAGTGVVGAIWFALLFSGANDLTQLPGRDGDVESDKPAEPFLSDAGDAGETLAVAGARYGSTGAESGDAVTEPSPTGLASRAAGGPGTQSAGSATDVGTGSTSPATAATSPAQAPAPADSIDAAGPAPSSDAPETAGPAEEAPSPAPAEPVTEPGSSGSTGPPADAGPPESAGPPDQSNAPDHAGPG